MGWVLVYNEAFSYARISYADGRSVVIARDPECIDRWLYNPASSSSVVYSRGRLNLLYTDVSGRAICRSLDDQLDWTLDDVLEWIGLTGPGAVGQNTARHAKLMETWECRVRKLTRVYH